MSTLIGMGGSWCSGFQPYPDIDAPVQETNIAWVVSPFDTIYYVPVAVAAEIGGDDYMKIVSAAKSGADPGAAAILDYYKAWSAAGRADPNLLVHAEAMKYDPDTESTPQFDACAIMLAIELLDDEACEDRLTLFDMEAVHFVENEDEGSISAPPSFTLLPESFDVENIVLPEQCPALTEAYFDPEDTPEEDLPIIVTLGFNSNDAKESFYGEMAERMAGTFTGGRCYKRKSPKGSKAAKEPKTAKASKKGGKEPKKAAKKAVKTPKKASKWSNF